MPGLYSITTRGTGTVLTASIYNTDHQNHVDNQTPQMTDDYSTNASQMQSAVDPGEVGTESLATSLAGELERLRFAVNDIKTYLGLTSAQWYVTATGAVALAKGGTGSTTAAGARTNLGVPSTAEAVLATLFAAKGDLMAASANDTPVVVTAGSGGDILVPNSGDTDGLAWVGAGIAMYNGSLAAAVASNALTVSLKTDAGSDPSDADPVYIAFRSVTGSIGTYLVRKVAAALSVTISSGSTLGTVSGQAHRLYVVAIDTGGTVSLGVYNPWDNTNFYLKGFVEDITNNDAVAEGGGGAADSPHTVYATATATNDAMRILGFVESTQATAGTWATAPARIQNTYAGIRKSGDIVQSLIVTDGAVATGTGTIPDDDTIPQNTEGNEFISLAVTPISAINILKIKARVNLSTTVNTVLAALFKDSDANAYAATCVNDVDASPNARGSLILEYRQLALAAAAQTWKVRGGGRIAGTTTFNGDASARRWGGVSNSYMTIDEIFV